jgi:hypothetical protein
MNTMATFPARTATSIAIRQPRLAHYKITARKSLLKRFQRFIESTDCEERYLCNHWIDKMCLCGIAASMIYFTPLLISILQE